MIRDDNPSIAISDVSSEVKAVAAAEDALQGSVLVLIQFDYSSIHLHSCTRPPLNRIDPSSIDRRSWDEGLLIHYFRETGAVTERMNAWVQVSQDENPPCSERAQDSPLDSQCK